MTAINLNCNSEPCSFMLLYIRKISVLWKWCYIRRKYSAEYIAHHTSKLRQQQQQHSPFHTQFVLNYLVLCWRRLWHTFALLNLFFLRIFNKTLFFTKPIHHFAWIWTIFLFVAGLLKRFELVMLDVLWKNYLYILLKKYFPPGPKRIASRAIAIRHQR